MRRAGIEVVTRRMMEVAQDAESAAGDRDQQDRSAGREFGKIGGTDSGGVWAASVCRSICRPADGKAVVECLLNNSGESDFDLGAGRRMRRFWIRSWRWMRTLMEKYLGGRSRTTKCCMRRLSGRWMRRIVVPILFADARDGVGMPELLDAIAKHFPSPEEGNPRPFLSFRGAAAAGQPQEEVAFEYRNDPGKPLLAHVFKVTTDPFVGKLAIFPGSSGEMLRGNRRFISGTTKRRSSWGIFFICRGKSIKRSGDHRGGYRGGGEDRGDSYQRCAA